MIKIKMNFNWNALCKEKEQNKSKEVKAHEKKQKYDLISTIVESEWAISC